MTEQSNLLAVRTITGREVLDLPVGSAVYPVGNPHGGLLVGRYCIVDWTGFTWCDHEINPDHEFLVLHENTPG